MIIQGRVAQVMDPRTGKRNDGSEWKSVDFIVEFKEYPTDKSYDRVALNTYQDKVIDNLKVDMMVKAVISHGTHEYNGRTYNDIYLHEIHVVKNQAQVVGEQYAIAASMAAQHDSAPAMANVPSTEAPAEDPDDLPF